MRPARLRAPDRMVCGLILVHDTRWAGVGNWAMFRPISANGSGQVSAAAGDGGQDGHTAREPAQPVTA